MAVALGASAAVFLFCARPARACGGCFHPPPGPVQVDTSVVTDHRMAFSISTQQTVLWDQIRYTGNPTDFAWVLPVKPGTQIQLSQDAWIAALDANTATVITGPTPSCGGPAPTDYEGGGSGGGCGFGSSSANAGAAFSPEANDGGAGDAAAVQVVSQQVVGPYEAVVVRSSQGEALGAWLRTNGYDIPTSIQPVIDAYTTAMFDFIALKLRPGVGVGAMQPVRVVTQGADTTLPLRMVAAGVGARVGLELYVLSEGRYHPQNFPDATIDFSQLAWDPYQSRSNYSTLAKAALAAGDGTGWLTEYAQPANLYGGSVGVGNYGGYSIPNPPLSTAYMASCRPSVIPCSADAGLAADAALADDAGLAGDADTDGGSGGTMNTCGSQVSCDDLALAQTGIATGRLWVTRLRADLPASALSKDLILEATMTQDTASNLHSTSTYTDPNYNPCPGSKSGSNGAAPAPSSSGCACTTAESPRNRYLQAVAMGLGAVVFAFATRRRKR
jgi:MYXO-CTERM domain-containing protein